MPSFQLSAFINIYKALHYIVLLLVLPVCVYVLYFAYQAGVANLYSYGLKAWHERWYQDPQPSLSSDNIKLADAVMQSMMEKQGSHPYYLILSAKQFEWQNYLHMSQGAGSSELGFVAPELIQQQYIQAALTRPTWPNTYVQMAKNAWNTGSQSETVMLFLDLAKNAAPYADETILAYLQIGLKLWAILSEQQRSEVAKYTLLAMRQGHLRSRVKHLLQDSEINKRVCSIALFINEKRGLC